MIMTDRAALRTVLDHPYLHYCLAGDAPFTAYLHDGAVLVVSAPRGTEVGATVFGDPEAATRLSGHALATGALDGAGWLIGPRGIRFPFSRTDHWELRWLTAPPAARAGEDTVILVDDADAVNAVLDAAMPASMVRPGHPQITAWYGIEGPGGLAAVAADQSVPGCGSLAGIAVHPDHQGRGLGATITTAASRRLVAEHGLVTLGVWPDNAHALAMYARLGFTGDSRTSGKIADPRQAPTPALR